MSFSTKTWNVGDVLTAADMNQYVRDSMLSLYNSGPAGLAYTTFAPVLHGTTSDPTMGSGTAATSRYLQTGHLTHWYGYIAFGTSGTAAGSGNYFINLPFTAQNVVPSAVVPVGVAMLVHGASLSNPTCILVNTGSMEMNIPASGNVGAAVPWAWSANDMLMWNITYEAA